jgi:agmatine deiminase
VCAGGEAVMAEARRMLAGIGNVTLHDIPTNDVWARDHGPMFLSGAGLEPALVDWEYNAWGGKYPPYDLDNAVPKQVAALTGRRTFTAGIVMEGGALDNDGQGTILTTESCLLNPNRNPTLAQAEIEAYLRDYACAQKVLWLAGGMAGDDTDGHIDELARFVAPGVVVVALENDPADENYGPLQDNYRRLSSMRDARGRSLEVVPIAMPGAKFFDDQRLPACYLNFYIANGVVIVPTFSDPADEAALSTLARLFPGRQIRGIEATDLVWGLGAFHCITQQQPA